MFYLGQLPFNTIHKVSFLEKYYLHPQIFVAFHFLTNFDYSFSFLYLLTQFKGSMFYLGQLPFNTIHKVSFLEKYYLHPQIFVAFHFLTNFDYSSY
jgi:hypothetical protein